MDDQKGRGAEAGGGALSAQAAADVNVVAKGGAVQVVGQVTQRGLSFFFQFVAFRILGAGGFGRYSLVLRVLSNAAQIGLAGYNYAAMRFITMARAAGDPAAVRGAIRGAFAGSVTASVLVTAALLVLAEPIASVFAETDANQAKLTELIRIGSPYILLFAVMQVHAGVQDDGADRDGRECHPAIAPLHHRRIGSPSRRRRCRSDHLPERKHRPRADRGRLVPAPDADPG
jgi:hypothetical protein